MESIQNGDDSRPTSSPYARPLFQLYFQETGPLHVPVGLLEKSPVLADRSSDDCIITLGDVSLNAGHVMIHFLYTDTYQSLKPEGQSPQVKRVTEFETSLRVFSLARVYRLPLLRDLATREIQRLGDGLSLPCILDVLDSVHRNLCDEDEWLEKYVASRTRSELKALDRLKADTLLLEIGCATTISKVLLRAFVDKELEEGEASRDRELPSVDHTSLKTSAELSPKAAMLTEEAVPEEPMPQEPEAEKKPTEEKPRQDDKPAEEGYYKVAGDDFYPTAEVPSGQGYPDTNPGSNHDFSNETTAGSSWAQAPDSDFSNVQIQTPDLSKQPPPPLTKKDIKKMKKMKNKKERIHRGPSPVVMEEEKAHVGEIDASWQIPPRISMSSD